MTLFRLPDGRIGLALSILVCQVVLAATLEASEVRVTVVVGSGEEVRAQLVAEPLVSGPNEAAPDTITRDVRAPGEVALDLDAAHAWRLRTAAPGFWSREQIVVPGRETSSSRLELVPTATIRGSLSAPRAEKLPPEIGVRLEGSHDVEDPLPRATVRCPVVDGAWHCDLPAGRVDLRLRARSFVSHYFWGIDLDPGEVLDLGRLKLRPGASVVGRVEVSAAERGQESPRVTLAPRKGGRPGPVSDPRLDRMELVTRPDARGFFHFQGVPAGEYLLRAELEGYAPASHPMHVLEDAESTLEEPLVLRRPLPLEVFVAPPFDPAGDPWSIDLARVGEAPGTLERVLEAPEATESGYWKEEGLAPGEYLLRVLSAAGEGFAMDRVDLGEATPPLHIEVPGVAIEGRVLLGDEPLAAVVSFGGRHGMVSVEIRSDEEGRFSGVLPRTGKWRVDVESSEPRLFRRLSDIDVRGEPGGEPAVLDLRLPAGRIRGEVVSERGEPTGSAIVEVVSLDGRELPSEIRSGADGRFELAGFEAGLYAVSATAAEAASDPILTHLEDGGEAQVRLVLRDEVELRGVVVSSAGGVPAARVRARPVLGASFPVSLTSTLTDVDGRFSLRLPAWVNEAVLTVFPPGFSLKQVRVPVGSEGPVTVPVTQHGGTLVLQWHASQGRGEELALPPVVIGPEGLRQDLGTLRGWASGVGARPGGGDRLVVPRLEPGEYALCWFADLRAYSVAAAAGSWPADHCSLGTLAPYGELRLTARAPS